MKEMLVPFNKKYPSTKMPKQTNKQTNKETKNKKF